MVRAASILVLAAILSPAALPFALGDPESALPPCCRRDGAHHCAMAQQALAAKREQSMAPGFRKSEGKCPFRSALTVASRTDAVALPAGHVFYSGLRSHPAVVIQPLMAANVSEYCSHHKRGPPLTLS